MRLSEKKLTTCMERLDYLIRSSTDDTYQLFLSIIYALSYSAAKCVIETSCILQQVLQATSLECAEFELTRFQALLPNTCSLFHVQQLKAFYSQATDNSTFYLCCMSCFAVCTWTHKFQQISWVSILFPIIRFRCCDSGRIDGAGSIFE